MVLVNAAIDIFFHFLSTIIGTLILLFVIYFIIKRLRKEHGYVIEGKSPIKFISMLSILLIFIIIFLYYPVESFLFKNFTYGDSSIDIYDKGINVLIGSTGVIVTSIFSYLIYIATKQGLKIADEARGISEAQATISANQTSISEDQTQLIKKQVELEELRYKDERTRKYNEIDKVPEVRLLMSIDYLLYEFSKLQQKFLFSEIEQEIKQEFLKEFDGDNVDFADAVSEGIVADKIREMVGNRSGKFSNTLTDGFSSIMIHIETSKDNFLLVLYMSRIKQVTFNDDYIHSFTTNEKYFKKIYLQRLRALFVEPEELLKEIIEELLENMLKDIFNDIFKDILLTDLVTQLHADRNVIINKLKLEIQDVFKGLINEDTIKVIDKPSTAYEKLWRFYYTPLDPQ